MAARKFLVGGNWKMNGNKTSYKELLAACVPYSQSFRPPTRGNRLVRATSRVNMTFQVCTFHVPQSRRLYL